MILVSFGFMTGRRLFAGPPPFSFPFPMKSLPLSPMPLATEVIDPGATPWVAYATVLIAVLDLVRWYLSTRPK